MAGSTVSLATSRVRHPDRDLRCPAVYWYRYRIAAIGFSDDYLKVVHKQNLGLNGRSKLLLQTLVAFVIAVALILLQARGLYSTHLMVPFFKRIRPDLVVGALTRDPHLWPIAFLPFIIFVIFVLVGSTNAVNLTDGLDGLAIGCTLIAAGALTVLTYLSGNVVFSTILSCRKCRRWAN